MSHTSRRRESLCNLISHRNSGKDSPSLSSIRLKSNWQNYSTYNSPTLSPWILPVMHGDFLPPTLHLEKMCGLRNPLHIPTVDHKMLAAIAYYIRRPHNWSEECNLKEELGDQVAGRDSARVLFSDVATKRPDFAGLATRPCWPGNRSQHSVFQTTQDEHFEGGQKSWWTTEVVENFVFVVVKKRRTSLTYSFAALIGTKNDAKWNYRRMTTTHRLVC
eukprot:1344885-Amphidinium_carterae.2